ncbi:glycosyltransferase family 2 protein [Pedobacter sp. SYSU D00535]|uniref:glycosyltransferase family 2 protein n=1 Tax=Pedobacter sp. SYSU D00535 TaxID=2810308 RepID=UPI001A956F72|nr:glycosyltransferase family 2 protein [Pedobacter sp. SYSU D00535]
MENPGISVIIPNYNGASLFVDTLPALFKALERASCDYEVLVVDDCSSDNSVSFLSDNYPQVRVIKNAENRGFSPTINRGIFAATKELVFLLNSDVKVTEDYFLPLFKYFEDEATFGVMGRIIGWDDEDIQDGAKYPEQQGFKYKTSLNCLPEKGGSLPSFYLSGANTLARRDRLQFLGGFDELFAPFYIEDVELSVRAWRSGWNCYYEHNAVCRHKTSTSIKSKARKRYISEIYNRNKFYFHYLHLEGLSLLGWLVQTTFEVLFRAIMMRTDFLKGYLSFLSNLRKVRQSKARFELSVPKAISLVEVVNAIKGKIATEGASFFRR